MSHSALSSSVIVSVVPTGKLNVPSMFPWANGVLIGLQGDLSSLSNLQSELNEVKKLVNADISKFGMNLKDFEIKIVWRA